MTDTASKKTVVFDTEVELRTLQGRRYGNEGAKEEPLIAGVLEIMERIRDMDNRLRSLERYTVLVDKSEEG